METSPNRFRKGGAVVNPIRGLVCLPTDCSDIEWGEELPATPVALPAPVPKSLAETFSDFSRGGSQLSAAQPTRWRRPNKK